MLRIICNKRGISIIEMMIAVVITMIGVLSIFMLQSSSWRTVAKSDYLGRASEILASELQRREALIFNPNQLVEITLPNPQCVKVLASDPDAVGSLGTSVPGDAEYCVRTRVEEIEHEVWRVTVTVTWPPLNSKGITENLIVTRQQNWVQ